MTEKQQTRQLWKQCFNDSDEFMDLYFNRRYADERNMAIYDGDTLVAALQMIPYTMRLFGGRIKASYISGAATAAEYRNKGIMTSLLEKTHRRMYDDGVVLSFLIPADEELFNYYSKRGYQTAFKSSIEKIIPNPGNDEAIEIDIVDRLDERIFGYFSQKMDSYPAAVFHDYDDMSVVTDDIMLSGGRIAVAKDRSTHEIRGVAFGVPQDSSVIIKECQADNLGVRNSMFAALMSAFDADSVYCRSYAGADMQSYGMIRVINMERLLSVAAAACNLDNVGFLITGDDVFLQNNGVYIIANKKVYHYSGRQEARNSDIDNIASIVDSMEETDIRKMLSIIFSGLNPYMNSMMD